MEKKQELISKFRTHPSDTGSPEIQIAILSGRISQLNAHFEKHKKDHGSRHGLLKIVGQRRKLLSYLRQTSRERYQRVLGALGLRK